jgi:hypothetical protein
MPFADDTSDSSKAAAGLSKKMSLFGDEAQTYFVNAGPPMATSGQQWSSRPTAQSGAGMEGLRHTG